MIRRLLGVTLVAGLAASACGGATASTSAGPITITFIGTDLPAVEAPIIAAFEAKNPQITVQYETVPFSDIQSVIQSRVGSGAADPDVYTADQPAIATLVGRGLLSDITADVGDISSLVDRASLQSSTVNGKLYALPISTSTQIMYYNVDLLKAAGLDLPSIDPASRMTWEDLKAAATKAQAGGAKWGMVWDQVNHYYQIQPLAESAGGGSGIDPTDELKVAITNDGWIKAMDYYASVFADGLGPRGVAPEQTPDLFANGQVAYFVGGPWWIPKFSAAPGLKFAVAPSPYFAGGKPVTPSGAWSWGINPHSDHRDAALAFIKFAALDPAGALIVVKAFALPPCNLSAYTSYYASSETVPGVSDLIAYEMAHTAVIRPLTKGYIQFEALMDTMLEDIRNGADVKTSLDKTTTAIQTAFDRLK